MTNKEFETKCLAVLDGTAAPAVVLEVVTEAACFRADYIDMISDRDIWDQDHCQVNYLPYGDDGDGEPEESDDNLITWAKNPTEFIKKALLGATP